MALLAACTLLNILGIREAAWAGIAFEFRPADDGADAYQDELRQRQ